MEKANLKSNYNGKCISGWWFLHFKVSVSLPPLYHSAVVYWSAGGDLVALCVLGISGKEMEHERFMGNDDCAGAANSDVETHLAKLVVDVLFNMQVLVAYS
jgi:hypothetical protein